MPKIRVMTPDEAAFWTEEVGAVIDTDVLIHPSEPKERWPHLIRHEIGHLKFPVEIGKIEAAPGKPEAWKAWDIFRELVANYYCLKLDPRDRYAKSSIQSMKVYAELEGFNKKQITRIDKAAREAVGAQF